MENEDENNEPKKRLDPLSKAFGLDPMSGQIMSNGKLIIPDSSDDYNYSRQNIVDLIEKGNTYLQQFGMVAMSAQEPRYIEVLTNLLNSLVAANEKLLDLKIKEQTIKAKEFSNDPTTINNNLFVGSTEELLEAMNTMPARKKKKKDDLDDE